MEGHRRVRNTRRRRSVTLHSVTLASSNQANEKNTAVAWPRSPLSPPLPSPTASGKTHFDLAAILPRTHNGDSSRVLNEFRMAPPSPLHSQSVRQRASAVPPSSVRGERARISAEAVKVQWRGEWCQRAREGGPHLRSPILFSLRSEGRLTRLQHVTPDDDSTASLFFRTSVFPVFFLLVAVCSRSTTRRICGRRGDKAQTQSSGRSDTLSRRRRFADGARRGDEFLSSAADVAAASSSFVRWIFDSSSYLPPQIVYTRGT